MLIINLMMIQVATAAEPATFVQPIGAVVQEWDPNIIPGVTDPFDDI